MTPGAAGTASYRTRGETVAQDDTDAAARLAEALYGDEADEYRDSPRVRALLPVVRVLQAEALEAAATETDCWSDLVMLKRRAATLRGEAGR
jgi:hypothetical protein